MVTERKCNHFIWSVPCFSSAVSAMSLGCNHCGCNVCLHVVYYIPCFCASLHHMKSQKLHHA
eukprot:26767-Amphidinium_carterae.1